MGEEMSTSDITIQSLEVAKTSQKLFDCFNGFILSPDIKVFGKLLARAQLFDKVKHIPGDIVECGVFKGTGIFTFLKLKRYLCPNTLKRVVGFDFYNSQALVSSLKGVDKEGMQTLFEGRNYEHKDGFHKEMETFISSCGFEDHEFELVQGNIAETAPAYVENNPGFRISLLYLDLDLGDPTYDTLCALWDNVATGGIVVFDEYAHPKWSESDGADRFFARKDVEIVSLDFICPSAYAIKK